MTNEQTNSNNIKANSNTEEPNIKWEYKILNINVETNSAPKSDPVKDSEKLNGYLSPDFIKKQFPTQYKEIKEVHPANQLQKILNMIGEEGWELVESERIGKFLFFIFKRMKKKKLKN